uniref:Chalcone-flavonone isomerase family protein n=1 Tax=Anthurium andraeanum TaxID=226677 RepID=A0A173GQ83_ANTAD|nr:chalcone isomerase [Anthurium andraeanum]
MAAEAEELPAVSELLLEGFVFPPTVRPPGSSNTLFLGGAGVRGIEIEGKFIKFTAIGVYLEASAVPSLAAKWKGMTPDEMAASAGFFRDLVTGPYEKFTRVTMILPLTGQQYSEKVAENCVAHWKAAGFYTDAEAQAVDKFKATFKEESFPPGSSILFTQSPSGTLTIGFSKVDGAMPEAGKAVIENRAMAEAVLESIIGQHGVSPEAKRSLASRVSELLKAYQPVENGHPKETREEEEQTKDQPEQVPELVAKMDDK